MRKHKYTRLIFTVQFIMTALIIAQIGLISILPFRYYLIVVFCIGVITLISWKLSRIRSILRFITNLFNIAMCVLLIVSNLFIFKTFNVLDIISGNNYKIDNMMVAVLNDNIAEELEDIRDYEIGVQMSMDQENIENTIIHVEEELNAELNIVEYKSLEGMMKGLIDGEVDAVIYNDAMIDIVEDNGYFIDEIKVIYEYQIERELTDREDVERNEPFNLYISGIDTYGNISSGGRSDVNIIMTVNPETKQILLTSTPRDMYVDLPGVGGEQKDKLTHAGIYGVDVSMLALDELYDIKMNYYVRVNFTSVVDIIDMLGGVEVYSEYNFKDKDNIYSFTKGINYLDGAAALAFSRERYAFIDGDHQRGKNQEEVIKGMLNKAMSPSIIIKAPELLSSVSTLMETSMPTKKITELIKGQLDDNSEWNVVSNSVTGTGDQRSTHSIPNATSYVMIPDQESIEAAKKLINMVMDGEILSGE